jgi:hypothetical protein
LIPACAEGTESPREELACCGGSARTNWVTLWRKMELDERRFDRTLKSSRPTPPKEIHKAEEKANGIVGSPNQ